jgi:hypothetical protein
LRHFPGISLVGSWEAREAHGQKLESQGHGPIANGVRTARSLLSIAKRAQNRAIKMAI